MPDRCYLSVKTNDAENKHERIKRHSTKLPDGAYSMFNTRTTTFANIEAAPVDVTGVGISCTNTPTTSPRLRRSHDKQHHRFSPNQLGIWNTGAANSLADVVRALDLNCDKSVRLHMVGEMWQKEKQFRMRQEALARRPIIREIEDRLCAEKSLPSQLQGAHDGDPEYAVVEAIHQSASVISPAGSNGADQGGGEITDDHRCTPSEESIPQFALEVGVSGMKISDIKPKLEVVFPAKTSASPSRLLFPGMQQNPTSMRREISTTAPGEKTTPAKLHPVVTLPHLRKRSPIRANPLPNKDFIKMGLTALSRTSEKTGKQSETIASKSTQSSFKIPENPHVGGYNISVVLPNPHAKIDVKGLKFAAWPQPVNRGDRPIQEPRTVIIAGFSTAPTLPIISGVCNRTGKLEKILIDGLRKKAQVTFIDAQVAHDFYTAAQNGLINYQSASLSVAMDYPVDMLPYTVQERNPTRMVLFSNWDKQDVIGVVGDDQPEHDLEQMLARLAYQYVPGGRVEAVTVEEKGWEYFDGTILFGGIAEAMAAYDGLKVETQFKGCMVAFGRDP